MASDPSAKSDKGSSDVADTKDDESKEESSGDVKNTGVTSQSLVLFQTNRNFDSSIGGISLKAAKVEITFEEQYPPGWFVNNLSGIWSGGEGIDTVFVQPIAPDDKDWPPKDGGGSFDRGFATTYKETIICTAVGYTLNPIQQSEEQPAGMYVGAQLVFAVRYIRAIESTQDGKFPFSQPRRLHDEVGYIEFCYKGVQKSDTQVEFKLENIVHSFTIPRMLTVLANCPIPSDKKSFLIDRDTKQGTLNYDVSAGKSNKNAGKSWLVTSGSHFYQELPKVFPPKKSGTHGGTGRVVGFHMKNEFIFVNQDKGGIGSTWTYNQQSPFLFGGGSTWPHNNKNTLTKESN